MKLTMKIHRKYKIALSFIISTILSFTFNNCTVIKKPGTAIDLSSIASTGGLNTPDNNASIPAGGTNIDAPLTDTSTGPGAQSVRRLSNLEYKNSLQQAIESQFKRHTTDTYVNWVFNGTTPADNALLALPSDAPVTKLATDQTDDGVNQAKFNAYLQTAYQSAKIISENITMLKAFAGTCVTDNTNVSNQTCVDTFINEFALLTFRTPPLPIEISEIKKNAPNWTTLIARILFHPRFLMPYYRAGGIVADGNVYRLTDYELAAKLASVFWKSVPDVEGLNAAKLGLLRTPAGLKNEIQRILNSPKAQSALLTFYRQWLGASRVPVDFRHGADFNLITAPINFSTMSAANHNAFVTAVHDEARDFLNYVTWTQKSKLEELFRSPLILTQNNLVAQIYQVPVRASATAPPQTDITGHHKGILSRIFITSQKPSSYGDVNPVQRGLLLTMNIMGFALGAPASFGEQNADSALVPATASTSVEVQVKTGKSACISCHALINPPGFSLSNFNSLGQWMSVEKRYYNGALKATNSANTQSILKLNGQDYVVQDLSSFVDAIVNSGQLYHGFSKYYFEYTQGRKMTTTDLEWMARFKLSLKNKSIYDALTDYALDKHFSQVRSK